MKMKLPASHILLGRFGEWLAARHLRRQGYRIEARNVRVGKAELDIVAWQDEVLCFIEVKTRRGVGNSPMARIDRDKCRRLVAASEGFARRQHIKDVPFRYEIIEVLVLSWWRWHITHHRTAFMADDRYL